MPALIETLRAAFKQAVRDAESLEVIQCGPVVAAIELYCKVSEDSHGSIEGLVDDAYQDARHVWGADWVWQDGYVVERVCVRLAAFASQVPA